MGRQHPKILTRKHRDLLLYRATHPLLTGGEVAAASGCSAWTVSAVCSSPLGKAYLADLEERLIAETLRYSALLPMLDIIKASIPTDAPSHTRYDPGYNPYSVDPTRFTP